MRALVGAGAVQLAALAALGWRADRDLRWAGFALFAVAFLAYLVGALVVGGEGAGVAGARGGGGPRVADAGPAEPGGARSASRRPRVSATAIVWGFAVAFRLALLPLAPTLSDDVYRYLWDGHVQLSGTNPYLYAPAAPELEPIRTADHGLVNNPTVPTIYPPLAQLLFLGIALLGGGIVTAKLTWLAFDLGTAWILGKVAVATDRGRNRVLLLYLWSPLLVIEVAWSGHLEPLGLFCLALALFLSRRPIGAAAALALSTLTKFAPAAALPALVRTSGWRALAAFVGVLTLLYLPYAGAGGALFTGLRTYGEHWWFMQGPFALLEAVFADPLDARRAAGALVALVVTWTAWRAYDLERALLWTLGAGMILTPTLHPWYVLWMLPLAALRASRPWILLGGLAFLGYYGLGPYHDTGTWPQPGWLRAAMWLPFLTLLAWDAHRARTERRPQPG